MDKLTVFTKRAKEVHGNAYDYSAVVYVNAHTKVKVRCPKHGTWEVLPCNHTNRGSGCPACYQEAKFSETSESFKRKAQKRHGTFYDYSKVEYRGLGEKVRIKCPEHGWFDQEAKAHLYGCGCMKCFHERKRKGFADFEKKAAKVHGGIYTYSKSEAVNRTDKARIKCAVHGVFEQQMAAHLRGQGCPHCQTAFSSKTYQVKSGRRTLVLQGYEPLALEWLRQVKKVRLSRIFEHTHPDPKKRPPIFMYKGADGRTHRYYPDFWIPDRNLVIEVKSEWTAGKFNPEWKAKLAAKANAVKALGFEFRLLVMNPNGTRQKFDL